MPPRCNLGAIWGPQMQSGGNLGAFPPRCSPRMFPPILGAPPIWGKRPQIDVFPPDLGSPHTANQSRASLRASEQTCTHKTTSMSVQENLHARGRRRFARKLLKRGQKGVLHAKFGVQVHCEECKRPCKSLAHVQALLHARAILKCSRPRARFESCTRASVQD